MPFCATPHLQSEHVGRCTVDATAVLHRCHCSPLVQAENFFSVATGEIKLDVKHRP
eukprot:m.75852 g.75852  ORF g.75852 m.75852 type:complete len:56 (-) comp16183_c0_seq5:155-322(-)